MNYWRRLCSCFVRDCLKPSCDFLEWTVYIKLLQQMLLKWSGGRWYKYRWYICCSPHTLTLPTISCHFKFIFITSSFVISFRRTLHTLSQLYLFEGITLPINWIYFVKPIFKL
jgi:hypothetical protein